MRRTLVGFVLAGALSVAPGTAAIAQPGPQLRCQSYIIDPSAPEPIKRNPEGDCFCTPLSFASLDFGPNGEIYLTLYLHCPIL
jgi:hypothetical protein